MLLSQILQEDFQFLQQLKSQSFMPMIKRALMGSSPAITQYLETSKEQLVSHYSALAKLARSGDQDTIRDLMDITDELISDGHIKDRNQVRTMRDIIDTVDRVIRSKREQD